MNNKRCLIIESPSCCPAQDNNLCNAVKKPFKCSFDDKTFPKKCPLILCNESNVKDNLKCVS